MSVSIPDTTASASKAAGLAQANAAPEAKTGRPEAVVNGQAAANINFQSQQNRGGPVFHGHQSSADPQSLAGDLTRHHGTPAWPSLPTFMNPSHWFHHFFPGHRPPYPGSCKPPHKPNPGWSNPPPRPNPSCSNPPLRPDPSLNMPYPPAPGRPHPHYARLSNEELAKMLRDNFGAFSGPDNIISVDEIYKMAKKGWSFNPAVNARIRLANELLRRPELMQALDRDSSTGVRDHAISWERLNAVIDGDNYFKYKTDKELAAEMYKHFYDLKGGQEGAELSFDTLRNLSIQGPTGSPKKNRLIQLAKEVLNRSSLLDRMDYFPGRKNDGLINKHMLSHLFP